MVSVAISQPAYLPWLGYFDLIHSVDKFILLDSVQFERQSWQQRNRIKGPTGLQWLTVPVIARGKLAQRIQEVQIREPEFWRDHVRAIELSYRRTPFFDQYFESLTTTVKQASESGSLAELTIALTQWFCEIFKIKTPLVRSSSLAPQGIRSGLLVYLCDSQAANCYLSPIGSAHYLLSDLHLFAQAGIEVRFQHYEHPTYSQRFPPFEPYASALDLVFNEGERALEIILSGRRPSFYADQVSHLTALGNAG